MQAWSGAPQLDSPMESNRKPQSGEHNISFETKSPFFFFFLSLLPNYFLWAFNCELAT